MAKSNFINRWTNWEYLPSFVINIPVFFYWLYFAIRSRSLFFFSRVNPAIVSGGMMGESKYDILQLLPQNLIPKTIFFKKDKLSFEAIDSAIAEYKISFPFIAKPDIGNRGFMVELIKSKKQLKSYLSKIHADLIIQEYIDLPLELGIFYYRFPNASGGKITSLCIKEMLSVTGDGQLSIKSLMEKDERAQFQIQRLEAQNPALMSSIPKAGERKFLEPIGNHSRGTKFVNGEHLIDQKLLKIFDQISHNLNDVYYGRYDIRCKNIKQLKEGKEFKILELNGCNSEATHIYDPTYSKRKAYRDIYEHWKVMFEISELQKSKGVEAMKWPEAKVIIKSYFRHKKTAGLG